MLDLYSDYSLTKNDDSTLQGGTVVNADHQIIADVLIKGGLIESVGPNLKVCTALHIHLRLRHAASYTPPKFELRPVLI